MIIQNLENQLTSEWMLEGEKVELFITRINYLWGEVWCRIDMKTCQSKKKPFNRMCHKGGKQRYMTHGYKVKRLLYPSLTNNTNRTWNMVMWYWIIRDHISFSSDDRVPTTCKAINCHNRIGFTLCECVQHTIALWPWKRYAFLVHQSYHILDSQRKWIRNQWCSRILVDSLWVKTHWKMESNSQC